MTEQATTATPPDSVARAAAALGTAPVWWTSSDFGLSAAERHVVEFADRSRAFVKGATSDETAAWLRNERRLLSLVGGRFGPEPRAWLEGPELPVLVTSDLSAGYWPAASGVTRWRDGDIELLLDCLQSLRGEPVDDSLQPAPWPTPCWADLVDRRIPVELGLCSPSWLDRHAATLTRLDSDAAPRSSVIVHGDIRSDNLCILPEGRIRLVDWSMAGRGDQLHDLLVVLPTLCLEGGPQPHTILSEPADLIIRFAGPTITMAAGDRPMPAWLHDVMLRLSSIQLDWVGHVLDDPPDGPC